MKRLIAIVLCLLFSASCAPAIAQEKPVEVITVTAIAETMEEGQKLIAIAVEYSEPFAAGAVVRASYSVEGRDVTRVYVNDTGTKGVAMSSGRFVLVELAVSNVPGSPIGSTLFWGRMNNVDTRINHRLSINPFITQNTDLTAISGNKITSRRLEVTSEVNLLADDFLDMSFEDPITGFKMNYRLFVPKGYEIKSDSLESLPIVLFLHGSGERGYNNISQLLANPSALEWMKPDAQKKHPCFVLAPQNPDVTVGWAANIGTRENPNWATTPHLEAAKRLVEHVVKQYNVDSARIYGTGLSQGSKGIMRLCIDYPDFFAAQVNVAGCDVYTDEEIQRIAKKPIWHLIAVDDATNPSENVRVLMTQLEKGGASVVSDREDNGWNAWFRGSESAVLAQRLWDLAKSKNANVLHTEFLAATVVPNTHWSWMAAYSNEIVRDWMFSHVNPNPNP